MARFPFRVCFPFLSLPLHSLLGTLLAHDENSLGLRKDRRPEPPAISERLHDLETLLSEHAKDSGAQTLHQPDSLKHKHYLRAPTSLSEAFLGAVDPNEFEQLRRLEEDAASLVETAGSSSSRTSGEHDRFDAPVEEGEGDDRAQMLQSLSEETIQAILLEEQRTEQELVEDLHEQQSSQRVVAPVVGPTTSSHLERKGRAGAGVGVTAAEGGDKSGPSLLPMFVLVGVLGVVGVGYCVLSVRASVPSAAAREQAAGLRRARTAMEEARIKFGTLGQGGEEPRWSGEDLKDFSATIRSDALFKEGEEHMLTGVEEPLRR